MRGATIGLSWLACGKYCSRFTLEFGMSKVEMIVSCLLFHQKNFFSSSTIIDRHRWRQRVRFLTHAFFTWKSTANDRSADLHQERGKKQNGREPFHWNQSLSCSDILNHRRRKRVGGGRLSPLTSGSFTEKRFFPVKMHKKAVSAPPKTANPKPVLSPPRPKIPLSPLL